METIERRSFNMGEVELPQMDKLKSLSVNLKTPPIPGFDRKDLGSIKKIFAQEFIDATQLSKTGRSTLFSSIQ